MNDSERKGPVHRTPRRRWTDSPWWRQLAFRPFENWYRDVLLLLVVIACGYAVHLAVNAAHSADDALARVQGGRRVAIGVTCAIESAISETGKATIESGSPLPPRLETFLEAHGYPPVSVRQAAAKKAGAAYVRNISTRVHALVGHRGDGLVRADGTVNCVRLEAISAVPVGAP